MAIDSADEENVEALKKWWQENGKQLLISVFVVLGGIGGWDLYQNSEQESRNAASDIYEEILALTLKTDNEPLSDSERENIISYGQQLREEYPTSSYASFGTLFAAAAEVENRNLSQAEILLNWILENSTGGLFSSTEDGLLLTTKLRLGRVLLAQGDAARALDFVNTVDPKEFETGFAELRGDIYVALDQLEEAQDAYSIAQQAGSNSDALRMKLQELAN
ncbi:MAG: tetratricopeptide repeat protein [Gammaproteobacteria bacterium]|nr:tetratricopeptide repeat protein [Gammaproteobacteria bacterium]MDG2118849.1 tetratricopeptide repeat protein [Gammaproteobacteria bacterium]